MTYYCFTCQASNSCQKFFLKHILLPWENLELVISAERILTETRVSWLSFDLNIYLWSRNMIKIVVFVLCFKNETTNKKSVKKIRSSSLQISDKQLKSSSVYMHPTGQEPYMSIHKEHTCFLFFNPNFSYNICILYMYVYLQCIYTYVGDHWR